MTENANATHDLRSKLVIFARNAIAPTAYVGAALAFFSQYLLLDLLQNQFTPIKRMDNEYDRAPIEDFSNE